VGGVGCEGGEDCGAEFAGAEDEDGGGGHGEAAIFDEIEGMFGEGREVRGEVMRRIVGEKAMGRVVLCGTVPSEWYL